MKNTCKVSIHRGFLSEVIALMEAVIHSPIIVKKDEDVFDPFHNRIEKPVKLWCHSLFPVCSFWCYVEKEKKYPDRISDGYHIEISTFIDDDDSSYFEPFFTMASLYGFSSVSANHQIKKYEQPALPYPSELSQLRNKKNQYYSYILGEIDDDISLEFTMNLSNLCYDKYVKAERKRMEILNSGWTIPLFSDNKLKYFIYDNTEYENYLLLLCYCMNDLDLSFSDFYKKFNPDSTPSRFVDMIQKIFDSPLTPQF